MTAPPSLDITFASFVRASITDDDVCSMNFQQWIYRLRAAFRIAGLAGLPLWGSMFALPLCVDDQRKI
jgi:hypothetical protein